MAVLNKAWGSMDSVPSTNATAVTGEEAKEGESKPALLKKPLFIYVTDGTDLGEFDKIEKVVLMDDKVCIGMWAFDCVKMTPDSVAKDELLSAKYKSEDRGFIFVSRDKKKVDVIDSKKMSAKNVFKTMKKHAKSAYKQNFEKNIKAVLKVLTEFDKIANQRKVLADKEARASAKDDKSAVKKIQKEQDELAAEEKKMNEKRDKLLNFELKPVKVA